MRADWKDERGFQTQGKRESVPDGWAIDRERAGTKGGEFGARDVQAERVRGGANDMRLYVCPWANSTFKLLFIY